MVAPPRRQPRFPERPAEPPGLQPALLQLPLPPLPPEPQPLPLPVPPPPRRLRWLSRLPSVRRLRRPRRSPRRSVRPRRPLPPPCLGGYTWPAIRPAARRSRPAAIRARVAHWAARRDAQLLESAEERFRLG